MTRWRSLLICILALSLALVFQNCTGVASLETTSPLSLVESQSPGGNGEGYDGKIYNLILAGEICADGDPVRARILVRDGVGLMIRQDCRDLSAAERFEVPLVFTDADKRILVYEGAKYLLQYVQFQELKPTGAASFTAIGTVWNAGAGHLPAIARLDDAGKPSWVLSYDHDFAGRSLIVSSLESRTDGLAFTASPADLNLATAFRSAEPALLVQLDGQGRPQSARVYGEELPDRHKLRFPRAFRLTAGRTLIGASLVVFTDSDDPAKAGIAERTAAGLVWLGADGRIEKQTWFKSLVLSDLLGFADGSFLLSGLRDGGLPVFVKVNAAGDVQWSRQIAMRVEAVLPTGDGGMIAAGSTEISMDASSTARGQALLVRLDASGDLAWARTYELSSESGLAMIASLVARPGGGYYAMGFADRPGRTATYFHVENDGTLTAHAELKPGFAARWKKAVLLPNGALWASLVDSDFRRVENSLNEVLVRLHPDRDPVCAGCVRSGAATSTETTPALSTPALTAAASVLSGDFRETPLRARSLGYPLFISP